MASPAIPPQTLCKLLDLEHLKAKKKNWSNFNNLKSKSKTYFLCIVRHFGVFDRSQYICNNLVSWKNKSFLNSDFKYVYDLLFNDEFFSSDICSDTFSFATYCMRINGSVGPYSRLEPDSFPLLRK